MKHIITTLTAAAFVFGATTASADSWSGSYSPAVPKRKSGLDNVGGDDGQFVFGVERATGLFFDRDNTSWERSGISTDETISTTTFGLFGMSASPAATGPTPSSLPRLALDYVIAQGITAGGSLIYVRHGADVSTTNEGTGADPDSEQDLGSISTFVINPRVGYAFPFDETFALWPRAGIAYASRSASYTEPAAPPDPAIEYEESRTSWQLTLDAMLVVSPFKHFYILGGPYLDLGLGGSFDQSASDGTPTDERNAKLTSFGLSIGLGGYY